MLKQWFNPPRRDPIHGTPSYATANELQFLGYEFIYPNCENRWYCICDMACTYVLDLQIQGDHTITVHQGIAYTTSHFDPSDTFVGNVHRLGPKGTRGFKARAQLKEDEEVWLRECMDRGGIQLSDWESKPKLEDYLCE